jgi:GT2 family glycosyltransferase
MIGVVILNYNNWSLSESCARFILSQSGKYEVRVYLVDNNSRDEINQGLRGMDLVGLTIIRNTVNGGYSAGNNIGIRTAIDEGCSHIAIVNPDVLIAGATLDLLADYLNEHKNVGIVGPRVMLSHDVTQEIVFGVRTTLTMKYMYLLKGTWLSGIASPYLREFSAAGMDRAKPFAVHAVSGCCFMMSRNCSELLWPLDENVFLYNEELLIGHKMEQLKLLTFYIPAAVAMHGFGKSTEQIRAYSDVFMVESEMYYFRNYVRSNILLLTPLYFMRGFVYIYRQVRDKGTTKNVANYFARTFPAYIGAKPKKTFK